MEKIFLDLHQPPEIPWLLSQQQRCLYLASAFYQAQLHLEVVLEAFRKCLACASLFFFTYCLPLIPSNNVLPKPSMYVCIYKYRNQGPVCEDNIHAWVCWCLAGQFIIVSTCLLLQMGMLFICWSVTVRDSFEAS